MSFLSFKCTSCGADIKIPEGETFILCPFCGTSLFVDKSDIVFHYWIKPTLDLVSARGSLRRWMAGSLTVEKLEEKAKIVSEKFFFFPFWRIVFSTVQGEKVLIEAASSNSTYGLKQAEIPSGLLLTCKKEEISNPDAFQKADIPLNDIKRKIHSANKKIKQISLVHVPFFQFTYEYEGCQYSALVEGATGNVIVGVFPEKKKNPYIIMTVVSTIIFFLESLAPFPLPVKLGLLLATSILITCVAYLITEKY